MGFLRAPAHFVSIFASLRIETRIRHSEKRAHCSAFDRAQHQNPCDTSAIDWFPLILEKRLNRPTTRWPLDAPLAVFGTVSPRPRPAQMILRLSNSLFHVSGLSRAGQSGTDSFALCLHLFQPRSPSVLAPHTATCIPFVPRKSLGYFRNHRIIVGMTEFLLIPF
jgi:hypothetical protein